MLAIATFLLFCTFQIPNQSWLVSRQHTPLGVIVQARETHDLLGDSHPAHIFLFRRTLRRQLGVSDPDTTDERVMTRWSTLHALNIWFAKSFMQFRFRIQSLIKLKEEHGKCVK